MVNHAMQRSLQTIPRRMKTQILLSIFGTSCSRMYTDGKRGEAEEKERTVLCRRNIETAGMISHRQTSLFFCRYIQKKKEVWLCETTAGERERERERERKRERERERERERDRDTQRETHTHTHRDRDTQKETQR